MEIHHVATAYLPDRACIYKLHTAVHVDLVSLCLTEKSKHFEVLWSVGKAFWPWLLQLVVVAVVVEARFLQPRQLETTGVHENYAAEPGL